METIRRCIRVFYIARKPTNDEFIQVAKITGIGIVLLGVMGFVISLVFGIIHK
ncbi:protein translocase SEC61 complex subunit gamma [Candidatus Micrarchaeota archaeon]|nr:protein translocase SEC61 complex subunit gamma [Candidatus Micrarchaeota archaeon]